MQQKFPLIKTSLKGFVLQPLQAKHLDFLTKLLNDKDIQHTLFRKPTLVSREKEAKSIERMYEHSPAKEITYILTLAGLISETYIGYVKVKLIDWEVKSCYLSVAITPDQKFRGHGYAKICYDAFFEFLFSLGILKIYGRTNENNIATIKLNEATGFRLVGRQTAFMIYPNNTKQDDLLFERLSPALQKPEHVNSSLNEQLAALFKPIQRARLSNSVSKELIEDCIQKIKMVEEHPNPIIRQFIAETIIALINESNNPISTKAKEFDATALAKYGALIAGNSIAAEFEFLGYPITSAQFEYYYQNFLTLQDNKNEAVAEESLWFGVYTPETWSFLRLLVLGRTASNNIARIRSGIR